MAAAVRRNWGDRSRINITASLEKDEEIEKVYRLDVALRVVADKLDYVLADCGDDARGSVG